MRTALKFRERKRDSSSLVYVLHKTCNYAFSRRSRARTVKKCTKKRDARCKVIVLLHKPIASLTSSLPSPSSLLKLPIHFRYGSITWSHYTKVWHRPDQICDSPPTFEIDVAQPHSVTEVAPKSPFLCVNRSPIRYDFRAGAKAIRYCVNMA